MNVRVIYLIYVCIYIYIFSGFGTRGTEYPLKSYDGPAKSEEPVENGGKHPILYLSSGEWRELSS